MCQDGDDEDDKLLGVFSGHHNAQSAQARHTQKRFKDFLDGFCMVYYELTAHHNDNAELNFISLS